MALITLANLKTFLGITGSSEDAKLQIYVDSANTFVNKYTRRNLEETTYTEELYDGPGTNALKLKNYPVSAIAEILVWEEEYTEREDTEDTDGYWYNGDSGIIYYLPFWPRCRGCIKVTYTAGYAADEIPDDLYHATLALASFFRNMGDKQGLSSESLGSYAYSLSSGMGNMGGRLVIPDVAIMNILHRYRDQSSSSVY